MMCVNIFVSMAHTRVSQLQAAARNYGFGGRNFPPLLISIFHLQFPNTDSIVILL